MSGCSCDGGRRTGPEGPKANDCYGAHTLVFLEEARAAVGDDGPGSGAWSLEGLRAESDSSRKTWAKSHGGFRTYYLLLTTCETHHVFLPLFPT